MTEAITSRVSFLRRSGEPWALAATTLCLIPFHDSEMQIVVNERLNIYAPRLSVLQPVPHCTQPLPTELAKLDEKGKVTYISNEPSLPSSRFDCRSAACRS